jgi:hypothetical protein
MGLLFGLVGETAITLIWRDVLDSKELLGSFQERLDVNFVLVARVVHSVA